MFKSLHLVIGVSLISALAPSSPAEEKSPNFLVIMVDDLGYGDLGCCGATDMQTPHIDALFAAGMRFNSFYANCTVCSPTRASFLTGLYPDRSGVPGVIRTPREGFTTSWGNLRNDVTTLPQHLQKAGYHTALIGKWHLGLEAPDRPTDVGFQHFHGFLGDMMDDYYTHLRHEQNYMRLGEQVITPKGHATDLFSDWAIDYHESRKDAADPFFTFLAYNAPHDPIQPPADWLEKVKAREPGITEKRAGLVALIEHLDAGIGRVINHLKTTGQWENTVTIFTSDNGGALRYEARNFPFNGGKQDMLEGGLAVSTCVAWPSTIKPGQVSEDHISLTMDIYPTLAEIADAPVSHELDGRSFLPILKGAEKIDGDDERSLYWVRLEGGKHGGVPYHAVRMGDWKLLRDDSISPYRLYNLKSDPYETKPIPRQKAPQKYRDLLSESMQHINRGGKIPWR